MTAQTTTQRTAKHRLAVKERMARMESGLARVISDCQLAIDALGNSPEQFSSAREGFRIIRDRAQEALLGSECSRNSADPTQRGSYTPS